MLQKIVNTIAIASGVVSLTVVGLGGYVFIRKDAIIENAKEKVIESVMGSMSGLLPDAIGGAMPDVTGDAVPSSGISLPNF
tara:strand:- start:1161 stop:1403 length:243 start_codon:yes stop_codon:yes gene_type:complete